VDAIQNAWTPIGQRLLHHVAGEPCESIHPPNCPRRTVEVACDLLGLIIFAKVDDVELALSRDVSIITWSHGSSWEEMVTRTRNISERKSITIRLRYQRRCGAANLGAGASGLRFFNLLYAVAPSFSRPSYFLYSTLCVPRHNSVPAP
jgi:hypothetical protein